ncbi:MAG TPA: class I SAM-dependent methyltransferase [Streptosporangiaceae bacterium]
MITSRTPETGRPAPRSTRTDLFARRVCDKAAETALRPVRILAAGCGDPAMPGLDLGRVDHHVTGIDEDTPALRAHAGTRPDVHVAQLGDLRTAALPPRTFDIVYSAYLVERTPHAELVLDRCISALRPGGLLLLRLRDRESALGFHDRVLLGLPVLAALRRLLAHRTPRDHEPEPADAQARPLPAVYGPLASARGIHWYCLMRGLSIAEEYADRTAAPGSALTSLCRLIHLASRGRLSADHDELVFIIRKPENRAARLL